MARRKVAWAVVVMGRMGDGDDGQTMMDQGSGHDRSWRSQIQNREEEGDGHGSSLGRRGAVVDREEDKSDMGCNGDGKETMVERGDKKTEMMVMVAWQ